jgi:hypothetical protein
MSQEHDECCDRCGSPDPEIRTLWHACTYEMNETGLPFEQVMLRGTRHEFKGFEWVPGLPAHHRFAKFSEKTDGEATDRQFYTLKVCKDCRASWMDALTSWFRTPAPKEESPGTGIFVRDMGALREVTEAEWKARNPDGREPLRVNED